MDDIHTRVSSFKKISKKEYEPKWCNFILKEFKKNKTKGTTLGDIKYDLSHHLNPFDYE